MNRRAARLRTLLLALAAGLIWLPAAGAADIDEFKVKREQVFEFAEKPRVTRNGDSVTITFATKGYCDATVAVEDADPSTGSGQGGRIVRHLASGVLGKNAPPPFQKNSMEQKIVWDGKDDQGRYIDDKDPLVVRVSLGLKPRFERNLFWTPYKRVARANLPIVKACPEGVLVYDGQIYDSIRLHDHDGSYLRTVYPFPAGEIGNIPDLHWRVFPQDGARLPAKEWFRQATLLTSGTNSNHPFRGFGEQRHAHDGHGAGAPHHAASAMAVRGGRIALAMHWLNRLSADGGSGGLKLNGPNVSFKTTKGGYYASEARKIVTVGPTSAALSPDGRWLYMTGYTWIASFGTGGRKNFWLPGVVRLKFEENAEPELFAGSMKKGEDGEDDAHFRVPTSVACDSRGRVYVADYMNDRIQVYLPGGKLFKTVRVKKPAQVALHRRTDEIFVFSWLVGNWRLQKSKEKVPARLIRLGSLEAPRKPTSYRLPLIRYREEAGPWTSGLHYAAEVDSWAKEPAVWLYPGHHVIMSFIGYKGHIRGKHYWQTTGVQMLAIEGDKLVVKRDFGAEAARAVLKSSRVVGTNRNLCVNHRTGKLYVGDGSASIGFSFSLVVEIDPETGKSKLVELPFDAEQMAFDLNGLAYLRARGVIVRYDPSTWREVPWDYGESLKSVGVASSQAGGPGMKRAEDVISGLVVPYWEHAPNGVFSVSPKGHVVIPIKGKAAAKSGLVFRRKEEKKITNAKPYQFQLYPGRSVSGLVMVCDRHGRMVYDDAVPGLTYTHGIKIDKDDNLYALALATRVLDGKPYFNPATCTLIKFKPRKAKIRGIHKKAVPVPMKDASLPERPPDIVSGGKPGLGRGWVEGAEWFYGGVGYNGEHHKNPDYGCDCCFSSFDLDYFARSFAPEVGHCSVAVLDTNGNLILRIGKYGNADDGVPLIPHPALRNPNSIGGDQVALFYAPHLAVHTDRRLFIADVGNERIVSVKLGYHATEKIRLKNVPDRAKDGR